MGTGKLSGESAINKNTIQGKVDSRHRNQDKLRIPYLGMDLASQC